MATMTSRRRLRQILATVGIVPLLSLASTALAQDDAVTNFTPGASEQMKDLSWLIGEWTVSSKMVGLDGKEMSMPDTTSKIESVMDGCMLKELMSMKGPGQTMKMTSFRSYDSFRDVYRDVWFDNFMGLADVYEGSMNEESVITMSNVPTGTKILALGQGLVHVRKQQTKISDDKFTIAFEISNNKGKTWTKTGTATYVRKSPKAP